jgi:hypothetical protein
MAAASNAAAAADKAPHVVKEKPAKLRPWLTSSARHTTKVLRPTLPANPVRTARANLEFRLFLRCGGFFVLYVKSGICHPWARRKCK